MSDGEAMIKRLLTPKRTAFEQRYIDDATKFIKTHPAFPAAYQFLLKSRMEEIALYLFGDRPIGPIRRDTIKTTILKEERALVQAAFAAKKSPAEIIYQLAERRGWTAPRRKRR